MMGFTNLSYHAVVAGTPSDGNSSNMHLTVSTPIVVYDGRESVAAVAGMRINFDKFLKIFLNSTRTCFQKGARCNISCESDVRCQQSVPSLSFQPLHV